MAATFPKRVKRCSNSCALQVIPPTPPKAGGYPQAPVISWLLNVTGASTIPIQEHRPTSADWDRLRQSLWLPPSLVESRSDDTLLEVILAKMPIPGPDVPLHEVLDFSQDSETIRRRRRLLRTLERAQIEEVSPDTFNLNLEEALASYEDHMQLADMRSRTSTLRILVEASVGVVEELAHLRPRGALNAVFEYETDDPTHARPS